MPFPRYIASTTDGIVQIADEIRAESGQVIPLTPEADLAASDLHLDLDFLDGRLNWERLKAFGTHGYVQTKAVCMELDQGQEIPLADACLHPLKRILDSSAVARERALALAGKPNPKIHFVDTSGLQSLLLQAALADLDMGLPPAMKTVVRELRPAPVCPSSIPPLHDRIRKLLSYSWRMRWPRRIRTEKQPALIFNPHQDILEILPSLADEIGELLIMDRCTIYPVWPPRTAIANIGPALISPGTDSPIPIPQRDMIIKALRHIDFLSFSDSRCLREITETRISHMLSNLASEVCAHWQIGTAIAKAKPTLTLLCGCTCEPTHRAFVKAATRHGAQALGFQHGGGYGMTNSFLMAHTDLDVTDRFMTYGPATTRYFQETNFDRPLRATPETIGAPALSRIRPRGDPAKKRVVYVPTLLYGEEAHLVHGQTDTIYARQIIDTATTLATAMKGQRFIVKIHFKQKSATTILRAIAGITGAEIVKTPLTEVLRSGDLAIIDCPSTTLLQAMRRRCQLVVFWDAYLGIAPAGMRTLLATTPAYTDFNSFLQALPRHLHDYFRNVASAEYSAFLDQYAAQRLDTINLLRRHITAPAGTRPNDHTKPPIAP